jgi:phage-related holin
MSVLTEPKTLLFDPDVIIAIAPQVLVTVGLALILSMVCDVILGLLNAFAAKNVNSTVSARGPTRDKDDSDLLGHAAGTALLLLPYLPEFALIVGTSPIFFFATESISVLENAGKLGIPIDQRVVDALHKIRGESAPPIKLAVEIPQDRAIVTTSMPQGQVSITTQDVSHEDQKHRRVGDQEAS